MLLSTPYEKELHDKGVRLPAVLAKFRTSLGRELRRKGVETFNLRYSAPRTDGTCNTITSVTKDNLIMLFQNTSTMEYKHNPTTDDLLDYFSERIGIRKMTETEALRLMDVDDTDIQKMKDAGIAKTNLYKLAGNSIVVSCLYHIFRTMFIPDQPEHSAAKQLTLF